MRLIKDITDDMLEEVHDAKCRAERAMEFKPLYPDIAQREIDIAAQELTHAEKDHKSAMDLIEEFKKTKGETIRETFGAGGCKHTPENYSIYSLKCSINWYTVVAGTF